MPGFRFFLTFLLSPTAHHEGIKVSAPQAPPPKINHQGPRVHKLAKVMKVSPASCWMKNSSKAGSTTPHPIPRPATPSMFSPRISTHAFCQNPWVLTRDANTIPCCPTAPTLPRPKGGPGPKNPSQDPPPRRENMYVAQYIHNECIHILYITHVYILKLSRYIT